MTDIHWTSLGSCLEGVGPSGHSYSVRPTDDPSGDGGVAWLVIQDGLHGYTFRDRDIAMLVAGQIEALTFGRKNGFEALDHMALLDAMTLFRSEICIVTDDDEEEDPDPLDLAPEEAALFEELRRVEAIMIARNIKKPSNRHH